MNSTTLANGASQLAKSTLRVISHIDRDLTKRHSGCMLGERSPCRTTRSSLMIFSFSALNRLMCKTRWANWEEVNFGMTN